MNFIKKYFCLDNSEHAAGVKQSAKISFDDDVVPNRSRLKALAALEKNNALNMEDKIIDIQDSNIKIEGIMYCIY